MASYTGLHRLTVDQPQRPMSWLTIIVGHTDSVWLFACTRGIHINNNTVHYFEICYYDADDNLQVYIIMTFTNY